jgi:hypothetical protein
MQQSEFYWTFHLGIHGKNDASEIFVCRCLRPSFKYTSNDLFEIV